MTNDQTFAAAVAEALDAPGRTTHRHYLPDGQYLTVRIDRDDMGPSLRQDPEFWGALHDSRDGRRPAGLDGSAVKVAGVGRYSPSTWLVLPDDIPAESRPAHVARARDWFADGWCFVVVTVERGGPPCACCGQSAATRESLAGIESDAGQEYLARVAGELFAEAGIGPAPNPPPEGGR